MRIVVHIGFPKAASTALQDGFFAGHPNLLFLGKTGGRTYATREVAFAIANRLRMESGLTYDHEAVLAALHPHIETAGAGGVPLVISDEALIENDTLDLPVRLTRLQRLFGDALTVLIVLREQFALIESMYKEDLRKGSPSAFRDYLHGLLLRNANGLVAKLRYDRVLGFLADHGIRFRALLYEDLLTDRHAFLRELERACGVAETTRDLPPMNAAPATAQLERLLAENRAARTLLGASRDRNFYGWGRTLRLDPLLAGMPSVVEAIAALRRQNRQRRERAADPDGPRADPGIAWPAEIRSGLRQVFAAANRDAEKRFGLGLPARGYPVD